LARPMGRLWMRRTPRSLRPRSIIITEPSEPPHQDTLTPRVPAHLTVPCGLRIALMETPAASFRRPLLTALRLSTSTLKCPLTKAISRALVVNWSRTFAMSPRGFAGCAGEPKACAAVLSRTLLNSCWVSAPHSHADSTNRRARESRRRYPMARRSAAALATKF